MSGEPDALPASSPVGSGQRLLEWAREWSYAHPRLKLVAREGWAAARWGARLLHLPAPFDPPELADLESIRRQRSAGTGPVVLVLSFRGWSTHVVIESLVASALDARGASAVVLTCGGRLPQCDVVPAPFAPPMPCLSCAGYVRDAVTAADLTAIDLSDLVNVRDWVARARSSADDLATVEACRSFRGRLLPLGELTETSVAWALSTGTVDPADRLALPTYQRFVASAVVLEEAFDRALDSLRPDRIFLLNGSFFAERILAELATARKIPVVRYERGFLPSTVLVSRWQADRDDLDPGPAAWREAAQRPLTDGQRREVRTYLDGRVHGERIINAFWGTGSGDADAGVVRAELKLPPDRPLIAAFCNILWDSAIQGKDVAFPSMLDWVDETVAWAAHTPGVHLVLRIHPAEVKLRNHPSRDPVLDHVARLHPETVPNLTVVGPADPLNSYALAAASDVGLVYTSTVGLEMAYRGRPVVVAAAAHFARRGFTWDPPDPSAYWATVEQLLAHPPDADDVERRRELAERYAHLFFFRFHQTIASLEEPGQSRVRLRSSAAGALGGGVDPGLDRVVDAVFDLDGALVTPAP